MVETDREVGAEVRAAFEGTGYAPVARIGRGASSDVYAALTAGGASCAVKVQRPGHFDASARAEARFLREAAALAAVRHPNVVALLDAGKNREGLPFLVMPLLRGETLRARLRRAGRLPWRRAASLLAGTLDGLDVAHRAGIVHRDVKPGNVWLTQPRSSGSAFEPPSAVLLDFGIAKIRPGAGAFSSAGVTTTAGCVVGTPRYLAPEQILDGQVDARTDVYAAALVLFEAVAGFGPFDAALRPPRAPSAPPDPLEFLEAHLTLEPAPLGDVAPVPFVLEALVARALEKSPAARVGSAGAFALGLRRALSTSAPGAPSLAEGRPSRPRGARATSAGLVSAV